MANGSEFGGRVRKNSIQPKGEAALTASEKLRLGYLTGTENNFMPLDGGRSMQGLTLYPQPVPPIYPIPPGDRGSMSDQ